MHFKTRKGFAQGGRSLVVSVIVEKKLLTVTMAAVASYLNYVLSGSLFAMVAAIFPFIANRTTACSVSAFLII